MKVNSYDHFFMASRYLLVILWQVHLYVLAIVCNYTQSITILISVLKVVANKDFGLTRSVMQYFWIIYSNFEVVVTFEHTPTSESI